jgi:hypothetical protein
MPWLVVSIVLSVILTVVLNVGLRLFPGAGRRAADGMSKLAGPPPDAARAADGRVRVWAPWKAMILASLLLTIAVNLVLWLARG